MWANTLCPFSSSTRNMALGSGSVTVPSTSIASFFGKLRVILVSGHVRPPTGETEPPPVGSGQPVYGPGTNTVHDQRKRPLTWGFERRSAAGREHLVTVFGHCDRVLEMRGQRPILGDDGPAVRQQARLPAPDVDHRFDGHDQPRLEHRAAPGLAVVRDLRVLVQVAPDPVADV